MKNFAYFLIVLFALTITANAQNKYVGVKSCGMCHKKDDGGNQLKIWQDSKHAEAFKTLQSEKADKIAAEKGFKTKAAETDACLKCHVTGHGVDAALFTDKFNKEDGVQCETCHGAGSEYKSKKVMEDHAKSVEAGMIAFANEGEIEKHCKTCHNSESPTAKEFKFEEMWAKIKHPVPAKG